MGNIAGMTSPGEYDAAGGMFGGMAGMGAGAAMQGFGGATACKAWVWVKRLLGLVEHLARLMR